MKVTLRRAAEGDLLEIVGWHTQQSSGMLGRFALELDRVMRRLARAPRELPVKYRNVRQALFASLPYRVFFVLKPDRVVVLAIMHPSRDPARWP